jgi:hypothetical protein
LPQEFEVVTVREGLAGLTQSVFFNVENKKAERLNVGLGAESKVDLSSHNLSVGKNFATKDFAELLGQPLVCSNL